ncbi:sugar ABC transporter permease [Tessaracoccus sp. MC1865]|uniref:carbohydrate ABC transporter permease n=1 Tax=Tessaracoccus sp. MC1865 TaxID=2760310 RepID=UPI001AE10853|nr:sugar ABC transporter permease [Tessaracoccus sp. MC1865]QTO36290.1 sugar ABC transporter permease [Tessaracoccus sp. MC1865]
MSLTATPHMVEQVKKRKISGGWETLRALPWLLPTLILIVGVVLYPAALMIYTSFFKYNNKGIQRSPDPVGLDNYIGKAGALTFPGVPIGRIMANTVVWVLVVVVVTVLLSLVLAQFLNKPFRGRKLLRLFIILPWACSVVMTATVFRYGLQQNVGLFNRLLVDTGILETARAFTKDPASAFWVAVFVAIYVSLPFTTYTILAGLQAVPTDVLEAAHVDGAHSAQRYWHIVLPLLRPAIAVAALINIINVFNSLPILRILQETPGYHNGHITTTLMYEYQSALGPGVSSALSVLNFLFCLVIIAVYLIIVQPTKEVA